MKNRFLILLLLPFLFPAEEAQSYPSREPPIIETRMWSPEDIEEHFQELKSQEIEEGSEYWKAQESSLVQGGKWVEEQLESLGMGWYVDYHNSWWPMSATPHSVVMRNVAYHYLKMWPHSREKIARYAWGSVGEQATYGKHFLKSFYQIFSGQRDRLKRQVFDHNNRRWFEQQYDKWVKEWGPDPTDLFGKTVPEGYVPEEFDGTWYLSVKLETDNLRYYACMEKRRHIFGPWDSTNTIVQSHLISGDTTVRSPYPVGMRFFLGWRTGEKSILFSDDLMQGFPWVEIKPREYRGPSGPSPHIVYEFEYPLYDETRNAWLPAKAVLASAPGPDYKEVEEILRNFKSRGIEGLGRDFRDWAGKYQMPD